ncbi:glycosyltransferase family 4 protein [Clostridium perfringens]
MDKKNILIITGRYLPGYKDGGPVRTIKNLVDFLGNEYNFYIITCDRDHDDLEPYKNININTWNKVDNANVYYVKPGGFKYSIIMNIIKSNNIDIVYCCGCFNDYAIKSLVLKRLKIIKVPLVIASMGLFSPNGFKIKFLKKKAFITIFNFLGMFKTVYWSVTSNKELNDIKKHIKINNNFFIAEDLPRKTSKIEIIKQKERGNLKIVWISRIALNKNLLGAIEMVKGVKSNVEFTIYGPKYDQNYWELCEKSLKELPSNIKWKYEGVVESEYVIDVFRQHHVFLFPTLGENYGHVIQEALTAGCPVILSNETPWKNFEYEGIGYIYPINNINNFIVAIEKYADMDNKEFQKVIDKSINYAFKNSNDKLRTTGYRNIFEKL